MISALGLMGVIFFIVKAVNKSDKVGLERYKVIIKNVGILSAPLFILNIVDAVLAQLMFTTWVANATDTVKLFFGDWANLAGALIVLFICTIAALLIGFTNLILWSVYWANSSRVIVTTENHGSIATTNTDEDIEYYGC